MAVLAKLNPMMKEYLASGDEDTFKLGLELFFSQPVITGVVYREFEESLPFSKWVRCYRMISSTHKYSKGLYIIENKT